MPLPDVEQIEPGREFMYPRASGWAKGDTRTFRCTAGHTRKGVALEVCMASVGFDLCLQPLEEVEA